MKHFLAILALSLLSGCAMLRGGPPLETVDRVDLERYMGRWYVIANIPYFGERGNVAGRAIYRLRDDGRIDDIYRYRDGSFDGSGNIKARLAKGETGLTLSRIQPAWPAGSIVRFA